VREAAPERAALNAIATTPLEPVELENLEEPGKAQRAVAAAHADAKYLTDEVADLRGRIDRLVASVRVVTYWVPVMLVTYVETFLVDALIEASAYDGRVVTSSEQPTTLAEILTFGSLEEVSSELRSRWGTRFRRQQRAGRVDQAARIAGHRKDTERCRGRFRAALGREASRGT